MIQDKLKTQFGKWIHGVLSYFIHFETSEHKKVTDRSFKKPAIKYTTSQKL